MKNIFILLLMTIILFSGCIGQKTVKNGDNISVDYIGSFQNGKVFDTSNESVAKENNLFNSSKVYKPLNFIVGKGEVIKGFDEGVIGMKVGETRTLTIPPEKAYGQINPKAIQAIPIIQLLPSTKVIPKVIEISMSRFVNIYGIGYKIGEDVQIPKTNINLTILNITNNVVSLSYNLTAGNKIWQSGLPWNETVLKIEDNNITLKFDVKKNDTIQFQGAPWNTSVVDVNSTNITLKHNTIPDTKIPSTFGTALVHFNDTSIIIDQNHELAGKTLIFKITLMSIG